MDKVCYPRGDVESLALIIALCAFVALCTWAFGTIPPAKKKGPWDK